MKKYFSERYLDFYYYIFFSLMVVNQFLPADVPEKTPMILGILGFIFVTIKILFTKYTKKETLRIILIGLLSVVTFFTSKRQALLFSMLAIVGIKNIDIKKCVKLILYIGGLIFILVIFRYILSNGLANEVTDSRYIFGKQINVYKSAFGYGHANQTFLLFSTLVISFIYLNFGNISLKKWMAIVFLTLGIFYYTFSRTGLIVIVFSILYYFLLKIDLSDKNKLKKILYSVPLLSIVMSFIMAFSYKWINTPLINSIDKMLTSRITLSYKFLNYFVPNLLGQNVDDISGYAAKYNEWYLICDNSFIVVLCAYGIIVFLLGVYSIYRITKTCEKDKAKLFALSSFCVYGIAESFFIIFFINFSMLFIKDVLYQRSYEKELTIFERLMDKVRTKKTINKNINYISKVGK